jgi:hypothetical protein
MAHGGFMPDTLTLAIEQSIAAAHRSLSYARDHASCSSDLGLHDDLQLILLELERLQIDLLRGRKPRRLRAELIQRV